jgi:hypothetical protein
MMKAILSSETSVLTRATRRSIAEDGILHSHRRENLDLTLLIFVYLSVAHFAVISVAQATQCAVFQS